MSYQQTRPVTDAAFSHRCHDGVMPQVSRAVELFASDGVLIAGGAAAILLQVADPTVAAGVARHSDFANRPVERLHNTLTFAYAVVLGTADDEAAVTRHVNRSHVPVERAEDESLQLWVAATLYQMAVRVHEVVYGSVAPELADELLAAYAPLGTSLQMPSELWPATSAEFDVYWTSRVRTLRVSDEARQIAHDLFNPTSAPWWVRAALPLVKLLTADLLPPHVRRAYRLWHGPIRSLEARLAWKVIRVIARVLPARVKALPARMLLRDLRRGLAG
jgi:uncharacterized protein (DUF2236 family)